MVAQSRTHGQSENAQPPRIGPYGVARHSGPFGMVPAALIFDKRISAEAKLVYAALASHADQAGECWPKLKGLAFALDVQVPAVSKRIAELVRYDYVEIVRDHQNRYYLPDLARSRSERKFPPREVSSQETSKFPPRKVSSQEVSSQETAYRTDSRREEQTTTSDESSSVWGREEEEHKGIWDRGEGEEQAAPPQVRAKNPVGKPPEEHPLFAKACEALNTTPRTDRERKGWSAMLIQLGNAGVKPDDMPKLVRAWHREFPTLHISIYAITKWLGTLQPPPAPQGAPKPTQPAPAAIELLRPKQPSLEDAEELRKYREFHDAERAQQRAQFSRKRAGHAQN